MKFSLDAIETLDAIDQHGSFAAAAASLHKAQSAVSYAVKQLEGVLGVALFDRSGHRARLTPAGLVILDEGRYLLTRARRIERLGEQFSTGWEPRLQVVIDGVLPVRPIMEALKDLADDETPTRIQVTMEFLGGVQRRFERDAADFMLALTYTPAPHLQAHPLPDRQLVLVVGNEHALAGPQHDTAALRRHLELSVHDSSDLTEGRDTHTTGGARVFYLSDFHTMRQALRMGIGFGWMPVPLIQDDLASGALVELAIEGGSRRTITPVLVQRIDQPLGLAGQRLFDGIRARWN